MHILRQQDVNVSSSNIYDSEEIFRLPATAREMTNPAWRRRRI